MLFTDTRSQRAKYQSTLMLLCSSNGSGQSKSGPPFSMLYLTWDLDPLDINMKFEKRESGSSGSECLSVSSESVGSTERYQRKVLYKLSFFWICLFETQARFLIDGSSFSQRSIAILLAFLDKSKTAGRLNKKVRNKKYII